MTEENIGLDGVLSEIENENFQPEKNDDNQPPDSLEPDKESLELFNEVRTEIGEKKFDGLMAAWQKDRRELMALQSRGENLPDPKKNQNKPPVSEEEWISYLEGKLTDFQMQKQQKEDEAVNRELEEVSIIYPQFTQEQILETAIKYSDSESNPISLRQAAKILEDIEGKVKASGQLKKDELAKKREAGSFAGKSGAESSPGLKKYNPKEDSGKSYYDLVQEGKEELGL